MSSPIPRIYVVSLASASERRARMTERLTRLRKEEAEEGISFELVDAVEATDPIIERYAPGLPIGQGKRVAACLIAHLRVIRRFLLTADDEAIVCEDDVRFANGFGRRFQVLRSNIPDETPLVCLSYLIWRWEGYLWAGKDPSKENLCSMGPDTWGTQMYLLRRPWAEECLERFDRPLCTIETDDIRTAELITRSTMTVGGLIAYPPLAIEELRGSVICPEAGNSNHAEVVQCWDDAAYAP